MIDAFRQLGGQFLWAQSGLVAGPLNGRFDGGIDDHAFGQLPAEAGVLFHQSQRGEAGIDDPFQWLPQAFGQITCRLLNG